MTTSVLLHEIGVQPHEEPAHEGSMIRQVMELKLVHYMAFFILVYVGAEVTIGSYLIVIHFSPLLFTGIHKRRRMDRDLRPPKARRWLQRRICF